MKEVCEKCNSVLFVSSKSNIGEIGLNTTITPELFIEGILNEISRAIQLKRKELGYEIDDRIIVCSEAAKIINFDFIRKDVLADAVFINIPNGCDAVFDVMGIKIGIKKPKR